MIINGHEIAGRMPLFQRWGRAAIRAGTKTQTRRTKGLERVNENPDQCTEIINIGGGQFQAWRETSYPPPEGHYIDEPFKCPYKPGEIRVMREPLKCKHYLPAVAVYADTGEYVMDNDGDGVPWRWKGDNLSHMFMPTEYGRTLCEITDIRVEKIQDISRKDAHAEGFHPSQYNGLESWAGKSYGNANLAFQACWDSINGPGAWELNSWVWVISFKKI